MKREERRKGTGFKSENNDGRITADLRNQLRQIKRDLLNLGSVQEELEELLLRRSVWTDSVS